MFWSPFDLQVNWLPHNFIEGSSKDVEEFYFFKNIFNVNENTKYYVIN